MAISQYQAIRAELEERIHSGEFPPGAQLPTEAELQRIHGVSRATAQKALNELALAGLVVRERRRGTRVVEGSHQVNLLRFVNPEASGPPIPGKHVVISVDVMSAARAEVDLPGIADNEAVTQLVRLKCDVDDNPLVVEVAAIPFALAPDLQYEDLATLTTRSNLASRDVAIAKSRMYLDAVLLEQQKAELLGVEPGVAALRRRRLMWQPNGRIAESAAFYVRPDALEFYVEYVAR